MRFPAPSLSSLALAAPLLWACGPTSSSPDGAPPSDDACAGCGVPDASSEADAAPAFDAGADADPGTPSGSYAYYFGDFETADLFQVARVDLGNNARSILALEGFTGGTDITGLAISPDNQTIAVAGQDGPTDVPELQLYAADGSGAPTLLYAGSDAAQVISVLQFSPDGDWVAFLSDSELAGAKALHVVPVDASAAAKRVSLAPIAASQDVASFAWAGDSLHIAFVGDLVTNNTDALWTVNATAISPSTTEILSTAELGDRDVGRGLAFDASDRLYFRADHELADNQFRLYRSAIDGSGRVQLPGSALTNGSGEAAIGNFGISADGLHIAFASDSPTVDLYQVFTLDLATAAPALVSNVTTTAPSSGLRGPNFFEDLVWSPDGTMLTMAADWSTGTDVDNDFCVFILPASGAPGGLRLAAPKVGSGDAFEPAFSADSASLIFRGDLLVSNHSDLYSTAALTSPDQEPASLYLQESVTGGQVKGFVLSN